MIFFRSIFLILIYFCNTDYVFAKNSKMNINFEINPKNLESLAKFNEEIYYYSLSNLDINKDYRKKFSSIEIQIIKNIQYKGVQFLTKIKNVEILFREFELIKNIENKKNMSREFCSIFKDANLLFSIKFYQEKSIFKLFDYCKKYLLKHKKIIKVMKRYQEDTLLKKNIKNKKSRLLYKKDNSPIEKLIYIKNEYENKNIYSFKREILNFLKMNHELFILNEEFIKINNLDFKWFYNLLKEIYGLIDEKDLKEMFALYFFELIPRVHRDKYKKDFNLFWSINRIRTKLTKINLGISHLSVWLPFLINNSNLSYIESFLKRDIFLFYFKKDYFNYGWPLKHISKTSINSNLIDMLIKQKKKNKKSFKRNLYYDILLKNKENIDANKYKSVLLSSLSFYKNELRANENLKDYYHFKLFKSGNLILSNL